MKIEIASLLILLTYQVTSAQSAFKNTLEYNDRDTCKASLSDIAWLQGHWQGEAFGGVTEEIWTPPLGKSMMCAFKLMVNNEVKFYEITTITEENQTLILRLKHFHGDLKGWEEKDVTNDFRLVKVTPNKVYFESFTIEHVSKNELNMYVVIGESKDKKEEIKFNYHRVKANP